MWSSQPYLERARARWSRPRSHQPRSAMFPGRNNQAPGGRTNKKALQLNFLSKACSTFACRLCCREPRAAYVIAR